MPRASCWLWLLLLGCAGVPPDPPRIPINHYPERGIAPGRVARVIVLPFENETAFASEGRQLFEIFLAELASANRFEVVPLGAADLTGELPHSRRDPAAPADLLVRVARRYGADGVLFGTVTHLRPYGTPLVGIRLELESTFTGERLWACDGVIDGSDELTVANIRKYFRSRDDLSAGADDYEAVRRSLSRFFAFVAHVFVERL